MPDSQNPNPSIDPAPQDQERQTKFLVDLCDLVAKNPDSWSSLRSMLVATTEKSTDAEPPQHTLPAPAEVEPIPQVSPVAIAPPAGPVVASPPPAAIPANRPAEAVLPRPAPTPVAALAPAVAFVHAPAAANFDPADNISYDLEVDPEILEERARANTVWAKIGGGSLMFATLFHVVLLIIGAFWIFQIIKTPEKKVDFLPGGEGGGGERSAQTKVQQKKRAQITPTTNVKRVFAEGATSSYAIPDPGDNFGEMSALSSLTGGGGSAGLGGTGSGGGFGKGHGTGTGFGGTGSGKMFGLIPDTMRKRCSKADRLQRLKDNGGTPECEEAVVKSLRWLKGIQNPDGSWGQDVESEFTGRVGMTSLVLLSYLGHCETPFSEEFGESCMKGIVFLVNHGMKSNGKLTSITEVHWCYEHAIATYALGEASTFCNELKLDVPNLNEITQKAGQLIINGQNTNGGWAYGYVTQGGHTDVSIVGWQIQALKACSHNRKIRLMGMQGCIRKGLKFLGNCQNNNGGYGYTGQAPSGHGNGYFTLTGVGVLCHQMFGKGSSTDVRKGIKYIRENSKLDFSARHSDLYQHYYESQAMMQEGGSAWSHYNKLFRDQILRNQNADGTWKAPASGQDAMLYGKSSLNGKIYRNCLCTLMLEVYYRFLATGGGSMGI